MEKVKNEKGKKKRYDCVSAVREVREKLSKELQGKSVDEVLEYYRSRRGKLIE